MYKIFLEDSQAIPSVIIQNSGLADPSGYTEASTIENFDKFWVAGGIDYKAARQEIKLLYQSIGWSSLSDDEKKTCARYFVCSLSESAEVYSSSEIISYSKQYHNSSVSCRTNRLRDFEVFLFREIGLANVQDLVITFSESLFANYRDRGVEGKYSGDSIDGLFDAINGTITSAFSVLNMRTQLYSPANLNNMSEVADYCLQILKGELF